MHPTHAVHFFNDDAALCRLVARFLGEGLKAGQPGLAIATPSHRDELLRELALQSFDVDQLICDNALTMVDAEATLTTFLCGTEIQAASCRATITELLERSGRGRPAQPVRVFGEMVDLLWRNSMHQNAVRLEALWHQIAASHGFSLLCSYSLGYFNKDTSLDTICAAHTEIMNDDGDLVPSTAVGAALKFAV